MATAWTALANTTLGSTAASVTFSSISQSYRDLVLIITGSSSNTANYCLVQFNGSGSFIYPSVWAQGNGASGSSSTYGDNHFHLNGDGEFASSLSTSITNIFDYAQTDKHKPLLTRSNNQTAGASMIASRWANTAAITSMVFYPSNFGSFAVGTSFMLYGVSA